MGSPAAPTACPRKPNGSTPPARAAPAVCLGPNASCEQACFDGGAASPAGLRRAKTAAACRCKASKLTALACLICTAMWEWVEDCWHANYQGAPDNGRAWLDGNCEIRVLRGGALDYPATGMRAANRYYFSHKAAKTTTAFVWRSAP